MRVPGAVAEDPALRASRTNSCVGPIVLFLQDEQRGHRMESMCGSLRESLPRHRGLLALVAK